VKAVWTSSLELTSTPKDACLESEDYSCIGGIIPNGRDIRFGGDKNNRMPALIWRLLNEERFLVKNLPGYSEYQNAVRHRLVQFIW
jgi:protein-S-isoprenylcysteine O-methyltransferase Ste14